MKYSLDTATEILERTPIILSQWLGGLSPAWTSPNEGPETWSPYDIIGHLIHGEKTDWIPRLKIILSDKEDKTFVPFDRFAQFEESQGKTLEQLLEEFSTLRKENLVYLRSLNLTDQQLEMTGMHPELGPVTLSELLASWVVHDLNHISQISRVMAHQYKNEVGVWQAYMGILNS